MGNGPPPLPPIPYPPWLTGTGAASTGTGSGTAPPGPSPPPPPPPAAELGDTIRGMVDIYGPVDYKGLIAAIAAAPLAERQKALNDASVRDLINKRLDGVWATTVMSSLLVGSQVWQNPTGNDFFKHFVTDGKTSTVPNSATMNCWESIMYAGFLAGEVKPDWIKNFYTTALKEADPNAAAYAGLGWSTLLPHYAAPGSGGAGVEPKPGQLIFFQTGSGVPGHVAVSLGGDQMISLWTKPNGINSVQQISVSDIPGTVYVGNPPW